MKIIAIIPARGGSKGIPDKNVKLFNGRPLVHYPVALARAAEKKGVIVDHVVSTDDERIASAARKAGGIVPFLRPRELATDESAVVDTVKHAVCWWEERHGDVLHGVLLLQPTNPLTTLGDIENSTRHYLDNQPEAKCLISVCDARHVRLSTLYHREGQWLEQLAGDIDPVARRQASRSIYQRNGAIYIARRDLLLTDGKILDNAPLSYEMPRSRSVAIDDMFEWTVAEHLAESEEGR